ncbi:hypothetical protein BC829DRAFT_432316 [Chytridium lagenaria]|nr:hypothetical protein BC829DRAFT_432316 [Chytridium lagenaria]
MTKDEVVEYEELEDVESSFASSLFAVMNNGWGSKSYRVWILAPLNLAVLGPGMPSDGMVRKVKIGRNLLLFEEVAKPVDNKHDHHSTVKMEEAVHVEVTDDIDPELQKYLDTEPLSGLTDAQVAERLEKFGHNEIPEKKSNPFLKFLSYFLGPISYLLEIATILSAVFEHWIDFGILLFVLIANACIGFFEEARAESALDALKNTLALRSRCWRNGKLVEVESVDLVPGDIIALRLGDIVPADCQLLGIGVTGEVTEGTLLIDQAALTGESLPVNKAKGATAYSSSIVKQGQMLAMVTKTGIHTYIGRAANLIAVTIEEGHFQKIVNAIGNFLIIITVVMVIIIFFTLVFALKPQTDSIGSRVRYGLIEVLTLTVAAIPVGLPTVLSVTMAVGASQLAKKKVIVKRLPAIEELASVSILCSDKTGSTPKNFVGTGESYTEQDLLLAAFFASEPGAQDAIESAVRFAANERVEILSSRSEADHQIPGYKVNGFIPFNPNSKYTEATVTDLSTGKKFRCIKGAPQVIVSMVGGHDEATVAVNDFARRGLRALGVARTIDEEMTKFEMIGMISLLDPPRPDSAITIKECNELGVSVKMITGDQQIIAKEVAHRLGMQRTILDAHKLMDPSLNEDELTDRVVKADGFAQVIPEHKYKVVELLQRRGYLVGMTGDGVNDAPPLRRPTLVLPSRAALTLPVPPLTLFFSLPVSTLLSMLMTLSFVLGVLLMVISFGHFFVAKDVFGLNIKEDFGENVTKEFKEEMLRQRGVVQTIMYLQISSCPHFVIFSTRVPTWFWSSLPSWVFTIAVAGTQVFAMLMSIFGIKAFEATAIGWGWGLGVMGISTVAFMVLDVVKVLVIRYWSFELTARLWPSKSRTAELARRFRRQGSQVLRMTTALVAWKASTHKKLVVAASSETVVEVK